MAKRTKRARGAGKPRKLSAADLVRLRAAFDRDEVDPHENLFGRDSLTWRINREAVLLLGGGRALLLQLAHPLVAAGVAEHSDFRRDPLRRLRRTLDLMLTITFRDAASALHAVRQIEKAHSRVKGTLPQAVGPFPQGTPYDANDPELLLWVHATLVDTSLLVYERFVEQLSPRQRAAYYEESKRGGRILGVPDTLLPDTLSDFEDYVHEMCRGETLAVGPQGKDVAEAVLWPQKPRGLRYVMALPNVVTFQLLPRTVRERYGFPISPEARLVAQGVALMSRNTLAWLPGFLRTMPIARGVL